MDFDFYLVDMVVHNASTTVFAADSTGEESGRLKISPPRFFGSPSKWPVNKSSSWCLAVENEDGIPSQG